MTSTKQREFSVFEEDKYGNCFFIGSYGNKETAVYRARNETVRTGVNHLVKDEHGVIID